MIILFFFFLLTEQQRDVEFNDKYFWTSIDRVTNKNIYRIKNLEQPYYYVQVTLLQQDLSYILLFDLNQIPKLNVSPGDYVSYYEERRTRFLKIEPNGKIIYITASSNSTSGYYNITIWGSKEEYCDNNCSNYGECTDDGCKCNSGYISTDCHQTALKIQESQTQINLFGDEIQYIYLNTDEYKKMDIQLRLSTDSLQGIEIFIELTNAIIIPNQIYFDTDSSLIKQQIIYDSEPLDFTLTSSISEYDNIQVVLGARQIDSQQNTLVSTLLIEFSTYNKFENTVSIIVIIIIVIVISAAVIIIIIMFFVCKNIRSRKILLQQQRLRMARQSSGNYQKEQINIFDFLSPVSINELNNQDDCTICLSKLKDDLEVRQTCCHHNFHSLCIKEWLKNTKTECPVCRANLVPKDGHINTNPHQ